MYNLRPGQRLTPSLAQRMVDTFEQYRREFLESPPEIELCFDGGVRPIDREPPGIRVLAAGPKNKADYLLVDRFRYHQYSRHVCLVITNDEEIQELIAQEGGVFLSTFDFVLLSHPDHPVLLPPDDLPLDGLEKTLLRDRQPSETDETTLADAIHRLGHFKKKRPARQKRFTSQPEPDTTTSSVPLPEPLPSLRRHEPSSSIAEPPRPHYTVSIATWPVYAGVRFLLASFCRQHRPAFISLLHEFDLNQLRPQDLSVLADFLLSSCGDEPGFTRRGSLMDRVRLALLIAGPGGLDLPTLAAKIGLKPEGLHGRIKRKANGWLKIDASGE